MPILARGLARVRTGARRALLPHERYAKLCCLEIERRRHARELEAIDRRMRQIFERDRDIDRQVTALLQVSGPSQSSSPASTPPARRGVPSSLRRGGAR